MCGPRDPIVSDWEQTDDNIANTCRVWIDKSSRYALPARKKRNKQRDAEPFHDR
jgi:hypothetical protein